MRRMIRRGEASPGRFAGAGRFRAGNGLDRDRQARETRVMKTLHPMQVLRIPVVIAMLLGVSGLSAQTREEDTGPTYTDQGELNLPEHYREWVYLSSGFDMSYNPMMRMGHHMFDNVFVYRRFQETGTWPDKTVLVMEVRGATGKGSINRLGQYQSTEQMGLEVHVKDEGRFPGRWAFFGFDGGKSAQMIPATAGCYTCHQAHGAVDTTFVQFYPTLIPLAGALGTLSKNYLKDEGSSVSTERRAILGTPAPHPPAVTPPPN